MIAGERDEPDTQQRDGRSIVIARAGAVATVELARPARLNALAPESLDELLDVLAELDRDRSVRALVLTGAGRAFCVGADLNARPATLPSYTSGQMIRASLERHWNVVARSIATLSKPTVAAVNGVAAGGGIGIALACDIVLAADDAYFKQGILTQLAMVPDVGSTWHYTRNLGAPRARALMLLGERLDADTAAESGLIWKCVPASDLRSDAQATAARLAQLSSHAVMGLREAIREADARSLTEQLALEAELNGGLADRPGFAEGRRAFLEKRNPDFVSEA